MSHPAFIPQPQHITAIWPVLISSLTEGRRLSWPGWLVLYRDGRLRNKAVLSGKARRVTVILVRVPVRMSKQSNADIARPVNKPSLNRARHQPVHMAVMMHSSVLHAVTFRSVLRSTHTKFNLRLHAAKPNSIRHRCLFADALYNSNGGLGTNQLISELLCF